MEALIEAAKSGAAFLGVCMLIFAGLILVAWLAQKFLCRDTPDRHGARYVAYVAVFSAIAGVLMLFEIPLFFTPGFYKIDLSEISGNGDSALELCAVRAGTMKSIVCQRGEEWKKL